MRTRCGGESENAGLKRLTPVGTGHLKMWTMVQSCPEVFVWHADVSHPFEEIFGSQVVQRVVDKRPSGGDVCRACYVIRFTDY